MYVSALVWVGRILWSVPKILAFTSINAIVAITFSSLLADNDVIETKKNNIQLVC